MTTGGGVLAGTIKDLHPERVPFNSPVVLAFQPPPEPVDATRTLRIAWYSPGVGRWEIVGGALEDGLVRVSVNHFSQYSVIVVPISPDPVVRAAEPKPKAQPSTTIIAIVAGAAAAALIVVGVFAYWLHQRRRHARIPRATAPGDMAMAQLPSSPTTPMPTAPPASVTVVSVAPAAPAPSHESGAGSNFLTLLDNFQQSRDSGAGRGEYGGATVPVAQLVPMGIPLPQ